MNSKNGALASAVGTFGSALCWLLSIKVVAFMTGPEGVGVFSQLRQISQSATIGATLGGTNTVVQGISERNTDIKREQFRTTAARIIGLNGLFVAIAMFIMAPQITQVFFATNEIHYVSTVRWLAFAVMLNVGGTYLLAVLNGYHSYIFFAVAQVAGPAAMTLFMLGVWWLDLEQNSQVLVVSLVLCVFVTYSVAALGIRRLPKFYEKQRGDGLSETERRAFIHFGVSSLIAALSSTVTLLVIRSWMINDGGLGFAGLFDAGWTLTFNYITLFLTACSTLYLPTLTAATGLQEQRNCMLRAAYFVLGVSMVMCFVLVLWHSLFIDLLYSQKFQASGQVVVVLAVAVMFRGVSWVYGTMMVAGKKSYVLIASDLTLNLLLLITTSFALNNYVSLASISWAFVLPHFLYMVFVIEYARYTNPLLERRKIWPYLIASVAPLIYIAICVSDAHTVIFEFGKMVSLAIGIVTCIFVILAYKKVVS